MPLVEAQTYHSLPPPSASPQSLHTCPVSIAPFPLYFPFDIDFRPLSSVNTTITTASNKHGSNNNNKTALFQHNSIMHDTNTVIHLIILLSLLQLIPFVLVYYIEECSPLVLFSWWRNKIS